MHSCSRIDPRSGLYGSDPLNKGLYPFATRYEPNCGAFARDLSAQSLLNST